MEVAAANACIIFIPIAYTKVVCTKLHKVVTKLCRFCKRQSFVMCSLLDVSSQNLVSMLLRESLLGF